MKKILNAVDKTVINAIGDETFGLSSCSLKILKKLAKVGFEKDNVFFDTKPWYNGRERGIVISMNCYTGPNIPVLHLAIFEYRTSDTICILKWETKNNYFNHPLENPKLFKEVYKTDSSFESLAATFHWNEINKVVKWVQKEFETYYLTSKAISLLEK